MKKLFFTVLGISLYGLSQAEFLSKSENVNVRQKRAVYGFSRMKTSYEEIENMQHEVLFRNEDILNYSNEELPETFVGISGDEFPTATVDANELDIEGNPINFSDARRVNGTSSEYAKIRIHFGSELVTPGDTMMLTFYVKPYMYENDHNALIIRVDDSDSVGYELQYDLTFIHLNQWHKVVLPLKFTDVSNHFVHLITYTNGVTYQQEFDLGGVKVVNYHAELDYERVPFTKLYYGGMQPEAAWRAEADASISANRKGSFKINIVEKSGSPLANKHIKIEQERHEFLHGGAIDDSQFLNSEEDIYFWGATTFFHKSMFNSAKLNNAHTWKGMEDPVYDWIREEAENEFKKTLRGHAIQWPTRENTPNHVFEEVFRLIAEGDREGAKEYLRDATFNRTISAIESTKDYVDEWSAIHNLPDGEDYFGRSLFTGLLSHTVIFEWLNTLNAEYPNLKLSVSESEALPAALFYESVSIQERLSAWKKLFARVPLYNATVSRFTLGAKMNGMYSIPHMIDRLDYVADMMQQVYPELKLELNDFELQCFDEITHAKYFRDILTIVFANPKYSGISLGQWFKETPLGDDYLRTHVFQGGHYKSGAEFANFFHYHHWSHPTVKTTDDQGTTSHEAYFGDYIVTVDGVEYSLKLSSDGPREVYLNLAQCA